MVKKLTRAQLLREMKRHHKALDKTLASTRNELNLLIDSIEDDLVEADAAVAALESAIEILSRSH